MNKIQGKSQEVKKHKFIVFGEDHYNPLGICRSLGEEGIPVIAVLVGKNPCLINHCKYVKTLHLVNTEEEGLELIIREYGHEELKPFILVGTDNAVSLLDDNYNRLKDHFYFFNAGEQGRVNQFMDKNVICDAAVACGIDKPKGETLKRGELPTTLRYPILTKVTKSTKGAWKKDMFICQNEAELKEAYQHIQADEILAQEFIVKKNELCLDGFSINGGEEIWMPNTSEYLRFTPKGYGQYMLIKPFEDEEVRNKIQNVLKTAHYSGVFEVEILLDKNDHLWFLEVNFRNSTWSYAYTKAGLNLPYQWAKSTVEGHIDYGSAHIRKTPFTAMAEFNDLKDGVMTGQVNILKWIYQFLTCNVHYTYNSKDKKPFFYAIWGMIKKRIVK